MAQNDLKRLEEALQQILRKRKDVRTRIANMAVARIGGRAVQDFMIDSGKDDSGRAVDSPTDSSRLTIRSQRLARAVKGGPGSKKEIRIRDAITTFMLTILVPYAAIHEFGGTFNVPITTKSRGFFWKMFFETKDEKWKWMAMTKKTAFKITMPKHPYIAPAVAIELPEVQKRALAIMISFIEGELGRSLPAA